MRTIRHQNANRRLDGDGRLLRVKRDRDAARVQVQAGAVETRRRAVDRIAQDREVHGRAMDPQLMGAAGDGA